MRWPWEVRREFNHAFFALGEDLEDVVVSAGHDVEDRSDVVGRYPLMEEVAHGVDEDEARLLPAQGMI